MQVYKIYCTLPNKSAMKNKIQKTKHAKCATVNLLAIRILKNSIMYSWFCLRLKELSDALKNSALSLVIWALAITYLKGIPGILTCPLNQQNRIRRHEKQTQNAQVKFPECGLQSLKKKSSNQMYTPFDLGGGGTCL